MFKTVRGWFSRELSIDLGTANTLIYDREQGMVLDEPSVVAIRTDRGTVAAVGKDAKRMLGRAPDAFEVIRPLRDGTINNYKATKEMLASFIRKVHGDSLIRPSPRVLVCVPCKATEVEKRAVVESAQDAGAREVFLIQEPIAAAIGANLPVHDPMGTMVVDIGGGTTEVGIVSLSGLVYSGSVRLGGDSIDEMIIEHVKRKHGSTIGEVSAERIKKEIGAAIPQPKVLQMDVRGHNLAAGVPKKFVVDSNEILEAIKPFLNQLIAEIRRSLEVCGGEISADIHETGIVLTGGGSLLRDLEIFISEETGLPVIVASEPLHCVARGCSKVLAQNDTVIMESFIP